MKPGMGTILKWILITVGTGIAGGIVTTLFADAVEIATGVWTFIPYAVFLMPLAGLLIVFLYKITDERNDRGVNLVIESARSAREIPVSMAPVSFAATVLSHAVSASTGRIGASLQIGASLSDYLSRKLKLSRQECKICVCSGMSACFSPLFGTPLAACFFAAELPVVGVYNYAAIIPCLLSALISQGVSGVLGIVPIRFSVGTVPEMNLKMTACAILIGVCCALTGFFFCSALKWGKSKAKKVFPNPYVRIVVLSIPFILLSLCFPEHEYNGIGMALIRRSFSGVYVPDYAFLMKILFTVIAVSAGFRGGEIGPALCIGSTMGNAAASFLNLPAGLCAATGMAGLFSSVTKCPFTAVAFSLEIFGFDAMPFIIIGIFISFLLSGKTSLYQSQKFALNRRRKE